MSRLAGRTGEPERSDDLPEQSTNTNFSQRSIASLSSWNPSTAMRIDIEKFDGTGDFCIWRRKISALLAQQRLLRVISDPVLWPEDILQDQREEMSETAMGTIIFHLSDSIIRLIDKESTLR